MTGPARPGGKRSALLSAGLVLAVLAAAAVLARQALIERYWILRLGSGDEQVRRRAAARLGELRSMAAAPRLIELLRDDAGATVEGVLIAGEDRDDFQGTMSAIPHALYCLGTEALPVIDRVLTELEYERLKFHGELLSPRGEWPHEWYYQLRGVRSALASSESRVELLDLAGGE